MIRSILSKLGLGGLFGRRETVATVRLDIIAEQVKEFNEVKRQINDKISNLESRTQELDLTVSKTLEITRENQDRLANIEESMGKIIMMSEALIGGGQSAVRKSTVESQIQGSPASDGVFKAEDKPKTPPNRT